MALAWDVHSPSPSMKRRIAASILFALIAAACGGGSDTPSGKPATPTTPTIPVVPTGPTVGSVIVSGASTLQAGATTKLTAQVKDASGSVIDVTVTWSSSDAS